MEPTQEGHECPSCSKVWPIHNGVSLFLPGLKVPQSGLSLPEEAWKKVCESAGLAPDGSNIQTLQSIFARNYQLPEFHLCAENNYFFQRVPELAQFLPAATKDPATPANETGSALNGSKSHRQSARPQHRIQLERHYLPPSLPTGQAHFWNVRIVNGGETVFASQGESPVWLGYRWVDAGGSPVAMECRPTGFPVPLGPARALTLPMLLDSPPGSGLYLLEIGLVDSNGVFSPSDGAPIMIQCVADLPLELPSHWKTLKKPKSTYNYIEDHQLGVEFLKAELKGKQVPRLLEVGGCCSPMTQEIDGEMYVTDIDAQTLQVGRLRFANRENMKFLASDAARLPFGSGAFDGVVLFATMHHFADPVACLKEFRRVIKPDGFIMMGTEPVGAYLPETMGEQLFKELESGINEQVFTAMEYQRIFLSAGLFATRVEIDRGALRAILKPKVMGNPVSTRPDHFTSHYLLRQWAKLNYHWAKNSLKKGLSPLLPKRKAG